MCGRVTVTANPEELFQRFQLPSTTRPFIKRYNLAPGQEGPIVVSNKRGRRLQMMVWGLIPHWTKDLRTLRKMINVRSESILDKPYFRGALRDRRCLLPVDSFFEWRQNTDEETRTPFRILRQDRKLFALAGVWDEWLPPNGPPRCTFSIVTVAANGFVGKYHDRMPLMLLPEDEEAWLSPATQLEALQALFQPYPKDDLEAYEVSAKIGTVTNDSPDFLKPVA